MMETDIYTEIARLKADGQEAAMVTLIAASGSTPRGEGAKMLVLTDGSIMGTIGGGSVEKEIIRVALEVLRKGRPQRFKYELKKADEGVGMICGGDMEVFIEPLLQTPTVFIFGAGHIAYALSKMAVLVGFKVVVVDDRPGYATPGRFPEASRVLTVDFSSSFSELAIDRSGYIVIVTYGHQNDAVVLEQALNTPARYIGMIGSNTKNEAVYTALKAQGVSQQQIERVYAPIGVPIRAHTPEEIAVSILGQMILVKRSD